MKKKIFLVFMLCLVLFSTFVLAADQGYEFNIEYEGEVIVGEEKDATVTLTGTEATPYTNVRVESEQISGPAKATIYAYDENGNKFDLSETGDWGPTSGFAVGGTFTNETPITITYPEAGTYVSVIRLVDLNNNNAIITSREFTVIVTEAGTTEPTNNVVVNNTIENIPQAGISFWVYLIIIAAVVVAAWAVIYYTKNNKG